MSLLGPDGVSTSLTLTALLLAGAGLYQFSNLKEACLSRCRAPLTFFLERWSPGPQAALKMGGQLGLHCLGCCWALMLLGFVGGTMNLVWMGVATVFMGMEKLPEIGTYLTRPVGYILLVTSAFAAVSAFGLI
jgi:predicted metal-binding membrane protein